jgi:hypothetical protein
MTKALKARLRASTPPPPAVSPWVPPSADTIKIVEAFDAIDSTHDDLLDLVGALIVNCDVLARIPDGTTEEDFQDAFRGLRVILSTVREHAQLIKVHSDAIYALTVDAGEKGATA